MFVAATVELSLFQNRLYIQITTSTNHNANALLWNDQTLQKFQEILKTKHIVRTILVVRSLPFPFSCACPFASPLAWPFTFPLHVDSCDDDICPFCIATLPREIVFK
jgi:hypothetical protein